MKIKTLICENPGYSTSIEEWEKYRAHLDDLAQDDEGVKLAVETADRQIAELRREAG